MNRKLIKNLVLLVALVAALFFVYTFMFQEQDVGSLLSSQKDIERDTLVQSLFDLEASVRGIKMDTSVFRDETFLSLKDYGIELPPQPRGRVNPFAPF